MRTFLYIDSDYLDSYLAQLYDGLLENEKIENETQAVFSNVKDKNGTVKLSLGSIGGQISKNMNDSLSTISVVKDIQDKRMHDNMFNTFLELVEQKKIINTKDDVGCLLHKNGRFQIIDFDYYKAFFDRDGFFGRLSKMEAKKYKQNLRMQKNQMSRDIQRNNSIDNEINKLTTTYQESFNYSSEQYADIIDLISLIIPYKRFMKMDNLLITLKDECFRDDFNTATFKYGGVINVVGTITNIVKKDTDGVFTLSEINSGINNIMFSLYDGKDRIIILHPLAIFYDVA